MPIANSRHKTFARLAKIKCPNSCIPTINPNNIINTIKLIKNDYEYQMYYDDAKKTYKSKHPMYNRKRLHLMALKKTAILFAKRIYRAFNDVAKEE